MGDDHLPVQCARVDGTDQSARLVSQRTGPEAPLHPHASYFMSILIEKHFVVNVDKTRNQALSKTINSLDKTNRSRDHSDIIM